VAVEIGIEVLIEHADNLAAPRHGCDQIRPPPLMTRVATDYPMCELPGDGPI